MKIYVSATYNDLQRHRIAVLNILRRMGHQPIGMEDYTAEGVRPVSRCLDDVASCDAYLCIVAWRYGYAPKEGVPADLLAPGALQGKTSITELEYRKALQKERPILVFLLKGDADWPGNDFDAVTGENEAGACVARFRHELSQQYVINYFRSAEELASLVSAAVYRTEMARQMDLESLNIKATLNVSFRRSDSVTPSSILEITNVIAGRENVQALRIDIGTGSEWWMTRLYLLCSLAAELTEIEIVVFEAGSTSAAENEPRRFIGTIHPRIVMERLASQSEKLRQYEASVVQAGSPADLNTEVSRRVGVWMATVDPDKAEAKSPVFVTEANLERWFSPYLMHHAVDVESGPNTALQMQRVLDWPMRFVPDYGERPGQAGRRQTRPDRTGRSAFYQRASLTRIDHVSMSCGRVEGKIDVLESTGSSAE